MSRDRRERRDRARDALPPANRVPQNVEGRFRNVQQIGVASWCPTPDGSGPAEAVALHFAAAGMGEFAVRLKTARAVDELIAMLERHRNDVWPGAPVAEAAADPVPRPEPLHGLIADRWADYERSILPPNASAVQRTETRRAFYAGCAAILGLLLGIDDSVPDGDGAIMIDGWQREVQAFCADVKAGRA